ncbi:hypothetical protein CGRA01v4_13551 [Colletotrichum graminicola]|nr:hypothetical protein CGRA01v4_13551 [Colletotrichum graminicola]
MLLSSCLSLPVSCLSANCLSRALPSLASLGFFFFLFLRYWSRLEIETNLTSHPSSQRAFPPTFLPFFLSPLALCFVCFALLRFACRHVGTRTLRLRGDYLRSNGQPISIFSTPHRYQSILSTRRRRRRQRLGPRLTTTRAGALFLIQPPYRPFLCLTTRDAYVVFANYIKDAELLPITEYS